MEDRNTGADIQNGTNKSFTGNILRIFLPAMAAALMGRAEPVHAALTAEDAKNNTMLVCAGNIHIEEDFQPPADPGPGTVFIKKPAVYNDSTADCYVRMWVFFSDSAAEDLVKPLTIDPGWSLGDDGAWYYAEKLESGKYTSPVFSSVEFQDSASQEEIDAVLPFDILVYAESVTAGNMSLQTAWSLVKGGAD